MTKLLSLLFLTTLVAFNVQAKDSKVSDISLDNLKKAIAEKTVTLIDVNGTKRYKSGHIPSAIDFVANKDNLAKLLPEDKGALIVAYCGNEYCGAYMMGVKAAQELGYTNVAHFSGGIAGWEAANEPVEKVAE